MSLLQKIRGMAVGETLAASPSVSEAGQERRKNRRLQSSRLTVYVNGKRHKTSDWSLGGFRVVIPRNTLAPNHVIKGPLHGPGLFNRGEYEACVVWVADNGEIGARFIELSPESFLAMSAAQV
jgi:hypothetical protein